VNNAGLSAPYGPTAHIPPDEFVRVLQTDIFGVYYGSFVALHHFLPRGEVKLINVLGRGDRQPVPFQNAYASSKAWVRHFTLALAKEYKTSGVGIYAFNPGLMDTDLLQNVKTIAGYEGRLEPLKTVMRLWSNPPEVPAEKAVWLASAATDGRTGLEVRVLSRRHLLGGVLREMARRLARRPPRPIELKITTVAPALPLPPPDESRRRLIRRNDA
jgi:NAD(P)-dependent dehydrogenase (short-subunit alcohol dehydrogenase family)